MARQCSEFFAFIKKTLTLFVMVFIVIMPAAYAATQTSFVLDAASPAFDFIEDKLGDGSFSKTVEASANPILYINIPAHATINTASVRLTGSFQDLGDTEFKLDTQSGSNALFDNNEASGASEKKERTIFTGAFTVPKNAVSFSHKSIVNPASNYGGRAELLLYNHAQSQWKQVGMVSFVGTTPHYLESANINLYPDFLDDNNVITVQYVGVTHPDDTLRPPVLGKGYQKSSYKLEKTPYNPSLSVSNTPAWSFEGQFKDIDTVTLNSEDFKNAIQTYVNSCDPGTRCSVPFSFTARTKGNITLDNINIKYTYSPSGVSTSPMLNSTTTTAGEESYVANLTSFDTSTVQDITINTYAVPKGASKCWEGTTERAVEAGACDITDFTWKAGETAPSIKVWSDAHDEVVPVSKTLTGEYAQNTNEETTVNGWTYITRKVILENVVDIFKDALSVFWSTDQRPGWTCTDCSGQEDNIVEGIPRNVYPEMKKENMITSVALGANDWTQNEGEITTAGGTAYVKGNIKASNSGTISYENVAFPGMNNQYRTSWTCSQESRTFNIGAGGIWTSSDYPTTCNQAGVVTKNEQGWVQDEGQQSTIEAQYIKETVKGDNTDAVVSFTNVGWSVSEPQEYTGDSTSGSFNIESSGSWSDTATATSTQSRMGKDETSFVEDSDNQHTLTGQKIKKIIKLTNNDMNIDFTNIFWTTNCHGDWNCDKESGNSGQILKNRGEWKTDITATNDVLQEQEGEWDEDPNFEHTSSAQRLRKSLTVANNDVFNFSSTQTMSVRAPVGWDCGDDVDDCEVHSINIPADGYSSNREWQVEDDVITESETGWVQDSDLTSTPDTQYIKDSITLENTGGEAFASVKYAPSACPTGAECGAIPDSFGVPVSGNTTILTASGDNIGIGESGWVENSTNQHTLDKQAITQTVTISNNYETIDFTSIDWSIQCPNEWNCKGISGITGNIEVEDKWTSVSDANNDVLVESWSSWEQDTEKEHTLQKQYLSRELSVVNEDKSISFTSVSWRNTTTPDDFNCDICEGQVDIEANGTSSGTLSANGDALTDTLNENWINGLAKAGGNATTSKDLRIKNLNNEIGFKNIILNLEERAGWDCTSVERVNVSAGETIIIQDAIICFSETVVEKSETKSIVSNRIVVNVGEDLNIIKTVTLKNVDDVVEYNTSVGTSVSDAFEDSVNVRTLEGQLIQIDAVDYEKGVVDWSVLIPSGVVTEYTVEYKVDGPYYSNIDEQSSQASVTLYEYFANITIPNDYSEGIGINAPISTGKFLEWDKHNSVKVLVDNEKAHEKITGHTINEAISDKEAGVKELQISYTVSSIELNTTKKKNNETSITVEIDREEYKGNTTFEGVKNVCIKSENETITCFEYDFSESILDLKNFEEKTIKTTLGGRVLRGFSLQKNQTKTVHVPKLTNSNKICIVDKEVQDINEVVCNGANNTYKITCNSQKQHNYTCTPNGTYYTVTGLKHSGIRELSEPKSHKSDGDSSPSTNSGSSGGSSSHRIVKKTPVEEKDNKVKIQGEETKLVNSPVFEINEKENSPLQLSLPQSKATGFFNIISLKTLYGKLISTALLGVLIAVFIGTRVDSLKFPKIQVPRFKNSQLKPEPKIKNIIKETKPKLNNHMRTILKVLHPREEEIMKTLMYHNGHATQARIYHATGIPTTSLSRWVDSLERRELVESTRRGKLRDLRVTKKFTGKSAQTKTIYT